MFYAHIILAQKGPLARVWLAAHWDKKITKAHVFETNIEKSVEGIMQPKVKLALRTSGHLLLGVVRIYSRKAKYLLADCNEAFVKIKMAFRPGMVDLPEGHREANVNAITLPEVFHDFDTALPELSDIDIEAQFSINQSRADEITMREDYGSLSLSLHDDGFGDIGFETDTPDLMRGNLDSAINDQLFEDEVIQDATPDKNSELKVPEDVGSRLDGDGFGDEFGQPQLFEDDLFGEPPLDTNVDRVEAPPESARNVSDDDDDGIDHFDAGPPSPALSLALSRPQENEDQARLTDVGEVEEEEKVEEHALDQSTLLKNEDESFALAPVDASAYKGIAKSKRKRKLIVDEVKNISGEEMKAQLADTSDIVTTLDLAPPTKRLMYWKETGGVEKLFSLPSRPIPARVLFTNYSSHLISRITQIEDFSCLGPIDQLALDHIHNEAEPSIIQNKRGRKRKNDVLAQPINQEHIESNTQLSIAEIEPVREGQSMVADQISMPVSGIAQDSLIPNNEETIFETMQSPTHLFSINDVSGIDQLGPLNDMALTEGNVHHGIDHGDDFPQGDATPSGLHHGQLTPHHSGIESIQSIPNLPVDQISSILNEAETSANPLPPPPPPKDVNPPCELASEWNEYDLSPSLGLQNPTDEQLENETDEQFEERVLNKRAAQLFSAVKTRLINQDTLCLSDLTTRNSRKQAAQKFYSLLVLKKFRALELAQAEPYSDVSIRRGPLFDNPNL